MEGVDLGAAAVGSVLVTTLVGGVVLAARAVPRRWLGAELAALLGLVALFLTSGLPTSRVVWASAVDLQVAFGLLAWGFLSSVRPEIREERAAATVVFTSITFGSLAGAAVASRLPNTSLAGRCVVLAVASGALSPFGNPATLIWGDPTLQWVSLLPAVLAAMVVAWPGGGLLPTSPQQFSPLMAAPVVWLLGPSLGAGAAVFLCGTSAMQGLPLLNQDRGNRALRLTVWAVWLTALAHLSGVAFWALLGIHELEAAIPSFLLPGALAVGALVEPTVAASALSRITQLGTLSDGTATALWIGLAVHPTLPLAMLWQRHGQAALVAAAPGLTVLFGLLLFAGLGL